MNKVLPKSAQKVQDYLTQNGQNIHIKEMLKSTRSAAEAAASIGCEVAQIAKSIVFIEQLTNEPVLVIASGKNRISQDKLEGFLKTKIIQADAKYIKKEIGYAIGGVPPVAHKTPVKIILDQELNRYSEIWAAAGTPFTVFNIEPQQLAKISNGIWLDVAVD